MLWSWLVCVVENRQSHLCRTWLFFSCLLLAGTDVTFTQLLWCGDRFYFIIYISYSSGETDQQPFLNLTQTHILPYFFLVRNVCKPSSLENSMFGSQLFSLGFWLEMPMLKFPLTRWVPTEYSKINKSIHNLADFFQSTEHQLHLQKKQCNSLVIKSVLHCLQHSFWNKLKTGFCGKYLKLNLSSWALLRK